MLIFVFFFHPLFQTSCTLTLFNMTDENIIISARLPHDSKINPMELLRKEKVNFSSYLIWFMCCYFMCVFPFTIFFFFFLSESRMLCFIATTNKKKEKFSIVLFSVYYFTFYLIFEFIVKCFSFLFRLVRWMAYEFVTLFGLYDELETISFF